MKDIIKGMCRTIIYLGNYELIRALWITIDAFQGYEYKFEVSDSIATWILSFLLTIWVLNTLEKTLEKWRNKHD